MLKSIISRHRHKVTEAHSGFEFLQKMEEPLEALLEVCSLTDACSAPLTVADAISTQPNQNALDNGPHENSCIAPELQFQSVENTPASTTFALPLAYSGASYDLILMDNHMPKMRGPEATR